MSINAKTPWHKASFDRFLNDRLPQLLAERLPLTGYQVEPGGDYAWRLTLTLANGSGDVGVVYDGLPRPDGAGVFQIDGQPYVVVPTAAHEALDTAEIYCVGEQLYEHVQERIGSAPSELSWEEPLIRAWLPLDVWIDEFMRAVAQRLDTTNWISRHTHLRRLIVLNRREVIAPGQFGRVCPFETPEGPNLGRVFTVAVGAEIRDGKLLVTDERPRAGLGLSASMIPFLEHSDPNRLLMGANMLRQALIPPDPEPALVQTGAESDTPDFWWGRNLLTAFVSWGVDTFDDGILISQSCAQRLNYPYPAEPGDKLSNRHGTKGVVSRVLPDERMPHLPDGTPVELVYNFHGLHVRLNFGQVREALMGRIARAEGQPALAPPFQAPDEAELRERLAQLGLPQTGLEPLSLGADGPELERPSTVGWVYWGRLAHLAQDKVRVSVNSQGGQMQGDLENQALLELGAYHNLGEYLNTRSTRHPQAEGLAQRLAAGPVEPAGPPSPIFADLVARLQVAGIHATLEGDRLALRFGPPQGESLKLARPLPHPWLPERELGEIGLYTKAMEGVDAQVRRAAFAPWYDGQKPRPVRESFDQVIEANARLARMLSSQTPERLTQDAQAQLETRLKAFFDALLTPDHLRFRQRQVFSARAVITPGADLRLDQVGLADEIAWTLFGPLVIRELGDEAAVQARTERAAQTLDAVMGRSWLIVNRAPSLSPTALLAFHPLRDPAPVIRLHPLVCELLNADFDGDQVAVMLPVTEAAQREAGQRLSVTAHLQRDPNLLDMLLPPLEALWGLAHLSRTQAGREEISRLAGVTVRPHNGFITRSTLAEAMRSRLEEDGVEATLAALEALTERGFQAVQGSGASLSPFVGASLARPPQPAGDEPEAWEAHTEAVVEQILTDKDYASLDLGPQLLAVKIRARGLGQLAWLIGPRGTTTNAKGEKAIVRHRYVEGLTPAEIHACVAEARRGLYQWLQRWEQLGQGIQERAESSSFHLLARARRSRRPGIVFARAAAAGEVDPLLDVVGRLLVGLPVGET